MLFSQLIKFFMILSHGISLHEDYSHEELAGERDLSLGLTSENQCAAIDL